MSRKVTDLVNDRLIGPGSVYEGGKKLGVSGMSRKAALMQMADRADDDGTGVWCSVLRIAVWVECDERTARRVMRSLEDDGLIKDTGKKKTMPTGAVMPVYDLILDGIRGRPGADELLTEKKAEKVAKNKQDTAKKETRRVAREKASRDTMPAPKRDMAPAPQNGAGADIMARNRDTMPAEPVPTTSLAKASSVKSAAARTDVPKPEIENQKASVTAKPSRTKPGDGKLPGLDDLPKAKGRAYVGDDERAKRVYDAVRTSGLLHEVIQGRFRPKPAIALLTPLLRLFGEEAVLEAAMGYYRRIKRQDGGQYALALHGLCECGKLEELITDAAVAKDQATEQANEEITVDLAIKRLRSGVWREPWGDRDAPIYAKAREAMQCGRAA